MVVGRFDRGRPRFRRVGVGEETGARATSRATISIVSYVQSKNFRYLRQIFDVSGAFDQASPGRCHVRDDHLRALVWLSWLEALPVTGDARDRDISNDGSQRFPSGNGNQRGGWRSALPRPRWAGAIEAGQEPAVGSALRWSCQGHQHHATEEQQERAATDVVAHDLVFAGRAVAVAG